MKLLKPNIKIKVKSSGKYVPEEFEFSNLDILNIHPSTKILPLFAKKKLASSVEKKFGFQNRYMIWTPGSNTKFKDPLSCEEMATRCFKKSYKEELGDISYFVLGTTTSSRYTGSQATSILSCANQYAPAIEMKAGCSTSLASLYTAVMALASGHENAMVLCAETMSKVVNPKIRETWFGLGDGSACLWLENQKTNADFDILGMTFGTDGEHVNMYTTQGKFPPNEKDLNENGYVLSGNGDRLYELSLKYYGKMFTEFGKEFNLDEVTHLIPHQVNDSLITEIANKYLNKDKVTILKNNKEIGNIGGSSVLYTLVDAIEKQTFKKGDKILMTSVGGGLSYSMHLWEKL